MGTLLICLTALAGCASTKVYVLDQAEVVKVKAGDVLTAKFSGYFLSNRAIERVMNAKIDDLNL